jgi:hypothetical protein
MKHDSYPRFIKSEMYKVYMIREIEGKPLQLPNVEEEDQKRKGKKDKKKDKEEDDKKKDKEAGDKKKDKEAGDKKKQKRRRSLLLLPWSKRCK